MSDTYYRILEYSRAHPDWDPGYIPTCHFPPMNSCLPLVNLKEGYLRPEKKVEEEPAKEPAEKKVTAVSEETFNLFF